MNQSEGTNGSILLTKSQHKTTYMILREITKTNV